MVVMFVCSQIKNMLTSVTKFNLSCSVKFLLFHPGVVFFFRVGVVLPTFSPFPHPIFLLPFLTPSLLEL